LSVTRPFAPRDALLLRSLQTRGISLEIESDVLSDASPLRRALTTLWPLSESRSATLVLERPSSGVGGGCIQARWRRDRREADLTFAAPPLNGAPGAALVWQRLIAGVCQCLGEGGSVRIYAAVPETDQVALQIFRQVGFQVYTQDTVFRRAAGGPLPATESAPAPSAALGLEPIDVLAEHIPQITRLYLESLPDAARLHESPDGSSWRNYPMGGWPEPVARRVVVDRVGAVLGAWYLHTGPNGAWLHIVAAPTSDAGAIVRSAVLCANATAGDLPLHAAARGYEATLHLALREAGFEPVVGRFRLVKHTAVRVLEPAWQSEALGERRLEPAGTHSAAQTRSVSTLSAADSPEVC
jgi:hypothetical protein